MSSAGVVGQIASAGMATRMVDTTESNGGTVGLELVHQG